MAAVLACGRGAVVSHRTAAVLHGLMQYNGRKLDVTVPGPNRRRRGPFVVHRSTTLAANDTTLVNNIPCTTVARTLLDLADVVDRRRHERAFDQAEIEEVLDLGAIADQLDRNPTRSATRKTRALLADHYPGSTPTQSELEEAFLALCRRAGLPQPEVQQWIILPDGGDPIRADFLWREERVIVETDGRRVHGTQQAGPRDARREQRLIVHNWRPIRTGWGQVVHRPAELEATLKSLISPR
jgi:very-short-patch-repair endonuclease